MIEKIKQYRNLIFLLLAMAAAAGLLASDPLGCVAKRRYERAAIMNRMAIEKAETEKQIAVTEAEKEAEVKRIEMETYLPDAVVVQMAGREDAGGNPPGEGRIIWLIRN